MQLLASALFLTLLQCSTAQNESSITPADCDTIETDAGVALDLVNRHRRDGYVFGLFRVVDAYEQHTGYSSIFYLTLDVLETECSVLSGRHWESCKYSDAHSLVFGQCKIITYTSQLLKKSHQLYGFNCTVSPVPPDLLECKDCPVKVEVLEVTEQHKDIAAKALEKYNNEGNHTNYFNVDKVEKILKVTGPSEGHILGFSIKETNCSKSVQHTKMQLECDFLDDWHAQVGFCKATISVTEESNGTDINCELYHPWQRHYGQKCRYPPLGWLPRHPHHPAGHRHHHRHSHPPPPHFIPEDSEHHYDFSEENQGSHEGPPPPLPHGGPHHHPHLPHHHCPPPPQEETHHPLPTLPNDGPHTPPPPQEETHYPPPALLDDEPHTPPPQEETHHLSPPSHNGPQCPHPPPHHHGQHHPPPHHHGRHRPPHPPCHGPHCPPPPHHHGRHHPPHPPCHGPHCPPPPHHHGRHHPPHPPHHGPHCPPPPHHHGPHPPPPHFHHGPHCPPPPHHHGPHYPPLPPPGHPSYPHHHYYRHHCNRASSSGKHFQFQTIGAVNRIPVLNQQDSLIVPIANFLQLSQSGHDFSSTGEGTPFTSSNLEKILGTHDFPYHSSQSKSCPGKPKLHLPQILPLFPHKSMSEIFPK
ncbi:histidine-rich glycoprotein [Rhea pennata]|uniref:histidine-rich glycoprotein n=1 Tax=Rhea pennata TaxID=8795 RepID=UPI002E26D35D